MRATLLHNPGAGLSKPTKEDLIDGIKVPGVYVFLGVSIMKRRGCIDWGIHSTCSICIGST